MNPLDIFQVALAAVTRASPAEDFDLCAALYPGWPGEVVE